MAGTFVRSIREVGIFAWHIHPDIINNLLTHAAPIHTSAIHTDIISEIEHISNSSVQSQTHVIAHFFFVREILAFAATARRAPIASRSFGQRVDRKLRVLFCGRVSESESMHGEQCWNHRRRKQEMAHRTY